LAKAFDQEATRISTSPSMGSLTSPKVSRSNSSFLVTKIVRSLPSFSSPRPRRVSSWIRRRRTRRSRNERRREEPFRSIFISPRTRSEA
jgi:hypothetical protein